MRGAFPFADPAITPSTQSLACQCCPPLSLPGCGLTLWEVSCADVMATPCQTCLPLTPNPAASFSLPQACDCSQMPDLSWNSPFPTCLGFTIGSTNLSFTLRQTLPSQTFVSGTLVSQSSLTYL